MADEYTKVKHPAEISWVVIPGDYKAICDGSSCAAAILHRMENWRIYKERKHHENKDLNELDRRRGLPATQSLSLWTYMAVEKMQLHHRELNGEWSYKTVQAAFQLLLSKGYLYFRNKPNDPRNRTREYLFNPLAVQAALDAWDAARVDRELADVPDDAELLADKAIPGDQAVEPTTDAPHPSTAAVETSDTASESDDSAGVAVHDSAEQPAQDDPTSTADLPAALCTSTQCSRQKYIMQPAEVHNAAGRSTQCKQSILPATESLGTENLVQLDLTNRLIQNDNNNPASAPPAGPVSAAAIGPSSLSSPAKPSSIPLSSRLQAAQASPDIIPSAGRPGHIRSEQNGIGQESPSTAETDPTEASGSDYLPDRATAAAILRKVAGLTDKLTLGSAIASPKGNAVAYSPQSPPIHGNLAINAATHSLVARPPQGVTLFPVARRSSHPAAAVLGEESLVALVDELTSWRVIPARVEGIIWSATEERIRAQLGDMPHRQESAAARGEAFDPPKALWVSIRDDWGTRAASEDARQSAARSGGKPLTAKQLAERERRAADGRTAEAAAAQLLEVGRLAYEALPMGEQLRILEQVQRAKPALARIMLTHGPGGQGAKQAILADCYTLCAGTLPGGDATGIGGDR